MEGAMEPPRGVTPDFDHPYSLERYVLVTQVICFAVVPFFVLSRLYASFFIIHRVGIEEYTCLASWLVAIAYSIILLELCQHGGGVHQWNVHVSEMIPFSKLAITGEITYAPLVFLVKTTILLLYLRIFGIDRKIKLAIRGLLLLMACYYIATLIAKAAVCIPLRKLWHPETPGHCINNTAALLTDCAVSIISDLVILIWPMSRVWALQLPIKRKIALSAVFATGSFACLASIMRLYYSVIGVGNPDTTFNLVQVMLWSIPEINCGLICGCLPILPAFFQHLRSKLSPSSSSSSPFPPHHPSHSSNRKSSRRGKKASSGSWFLNSSRRERSRALQRLDESETEVNEMRAYGAGAGGVYGSGNNGGNNECRSFTLVESSGSGDVEGGDGGGREGLEKDCIWKKIDIEARFEEEGS